MRHDLIVQFAETPAKAVDVSIVMPCLNEVGCLAHCIAEAQEALARIAASYGLSGEVVIADNGSTDGSQALAERLGARVVSVTRRGYGAALIGGGEAAEGRYIVMGDADGSYDFTDAVAMIGKLEEGAELCMGSRFQGGIEPGAMPWKNRWIGNPVLTGILNLLFRSGIDDAHCGLRAIRKDAFLSLRLAGTGMEFASEMVIKASLMRLRITQSPAKLRVDLRDRAPHLRPWRDGWRHLRYLFMLSPTWLFGMPAMAAICAGLILLAAAIAESLAPGTFPAVGNYWVILASGLVGFGHLAGILALASKLYGMREGYRLTGPLIRRLAPLATLETMLLAGMIFAGGGLVLLTLVAFDWGNRDFAATYNVLPAVLGTLLLTLGLQQALGGFMLAILAGNEARFFAARSVSSVTVTTLPIAGDAPWLTVIMPVHNGEQWLSETLASAAAEDCLGVEFLILDSSANEGCAEIAASFQDRLTIRYSRPPGLLAWTSKTNAAASSAQSPWLTMLHQDDLWLSGRLAVARAAIARDPDAVLHLNPSRIIDETGASRGIWRCPLAAGRHDGRQVAERLLVQNFIAIPSPVIRRDAWLAVGGLDEDLWYTGDWDLYLKLLERGAATYTQAVTTAFRIHSGSLTMVGSGNKAEFRRQMELVLHRHAIGRPRKLIALAQASIDVNSCLAAAAQGQLVLPSGSSMRLLLLSPFQMLRYVRWSRIIDRVMPRLRLRLAGRI